jgi:hypothetical protein
MTTDVLAYADKTYWEGLKIKVFQATVVLRHGPPISEWERHDLADTLDLLADYAAVLRSQLVTAVLERRQSESEGAR